MVTSIRIACLLLAGMLLHVSSASACINDRDTFRIEREFRTNYEFKAEEPKSMFDMPDSAPSAPTTVSGTIRLWSGLGLALVAGGVLLHNMRR